MSKLIKVRQVIKLSGWVNGSGWSYKNSVYDDQIIDIDSDDLNNMDWDWWETDEDNKPSEDSDTEITVEFYAEDADTDEDKPLASHSKWESELWEEKHGKTYGCDREFDDGEIYKLDNDIIVLMVRDHDDNKTYIYTWQGEATEIADLPTLKEDSSDWEEIDKFDSPLKKDIQGNDEYDWDEYNKVANKLLYELENN